MYTVHDVHSFNPKYSCPRSDEYFIRKMHRFEHSGHEKINDS